MYLKNKTLRKELKAVVTIALWLGVQQGAYAETTGITNVEADITAAYGLDEEREEGLEGDEDSSPAAEVNAAETLQNQNSNITSTIAPEPIAMRSDPEIIDAMGALSGAPDLDTKVEAAESQRTTQAETPTTTKENNRTWSEWFFGSKPKAAESQRITPAETSTTTKENKRTWSEWLFGSKPKASPKANFRTMPEQESSPTHLNSARPENHNAVEVIPSTTPTVKTVDRFAKMKAKKAPHNLSSKDILEKKSYDKKYPNQSIEQADEKEEKKLPALNASSKALNGK